jgi:hypothetical protein
MIDRLKTFELSTLEHIEMMNDFVDISYDDILSSEKYLNDKYQYSENDVNSTIKILKTFEERNF